MTTAGETERQVEALLFAASAPLGAAEIAARLPEIAGSLHADNWAAAGRAIMTTDTFPKGASAEIEGDGRLVATADPKSSSGWKKGERVFHQKFGYGAVRVIEGNKLLVDFEKAGEKRVIDTFVEKA